MKSIRTLGATMSTLKISRSLPNSNHTPILPSYTLQPPQFCLHWHPTHDHPLKLAGETLYHHLLAWYPMKIVSKPCTFQPVITSLTLSYTLCVHDMSFPYSSHTYVPNQTLSHIVFINLCPPPQPLLSLISHNLAISTRNGEGKLFGPSFKPKQTRLGIKNQNTNNYFQTIILINNLLCRNEAFFLE